MAALIAIFLPGHLHLSLGSVVTISNLGGAAYGRSIHSSGQDLLAFSLKADSLGALGTITLLVFS